MFRRQPSDFANAGFPSRKDGFFVKCLHNACVGRDRLDFVAGMLARGWLTQADLTAAEFLAEAEWPEPKPLPDTLLPVDTFEADFLPATIGPWCEDIANRMQCPLDFVGVAALVALSSIIGNKICVRPKRKDDWHEAANLWGLCVGPSGTLKSPAMLEALKPLKRLDIAAKEQNEVAAKTYQAEFKFFKLKEDIAVKNTKKNIENGAGCASDLALDAPEEPRKRQFIVNDASYEKLGEILTCNPNGVLVFRDELITLLKHLDREEQVVARGFYLTGMERGR